MKHTEEILIRLTYDDVTGSPFNNKMQQTFKNNFKMNRKKKKRNRMVISIESPTINLNMTETGIKSVKNLNEQIEKVLIQALEGAKNN